MHKGRVYDVTLEKPREKVRFPGPLLIKVPSECLASYNR